MTDWWRWILRLRADQATWAAEHPGEAALILVAILLVISLLMLLLFVCSPRLPEE